MFSIIGPKLKIFDEKIVGEKLFCYEHFLGKKRFQFFRWLKMFVGENIF
jgi:hypothetical protein